MRAAMVFVQKEEDRLQCRSFAALIWRCGKRYLCVIYVSDKAAEYGISKF